MTARAGQTMIGYLVYVISPTLENKNTLLGLQNIFYVLKQHRGRLGPKLLAAQHRELAARGVKKVAMRSGVRAKGPKQKYLFERLGANYMGGLYYLTLEA